MAFTHIHFSQNTQYGASLRHMLATNEAADDSLADVRDMMASMIDGDGSQDAHYAELTKRFGFGDYDVTTGGAPTAAQNAVAHAAFLEIDSAYSKTSGDGTVSSVRAARNQLFSKLRG